MLYRLDPDTYNAVKPAGYITYAVIFEENTSGGRIWTRFNQIKPHHEYADAAVSRHRRGGAVRFVRLCYGGRHHGRRDTVQEMRGGTGDEVRAWSNDVLERVFVSQLNPESVGISRLHHQAFGRLVVHVNYVEDRGVTHTMLECERVNIDVCGPAKFVLDSLPDYYDPCSALRRLKEVALVGHFSYNRQRHRFRFVGIVQIALPADFDYTALPGGWMRFFQGLLEHRARAVRRMGADWAALGLRSA